jgi:hypothetical protein
MTSLSDPTAIAAEPNGESAPWLPSTAFLKFTILTLIVGSATALTATLIIAPHQTLRIVVQVLYAAFALLGWHFLARGKIRATRYVLVTGTWLVITLSMAATGGLRAPVIIAYPALIIFAGWVFGKSEAFTITAGTVIAILGIAIAESMGVMPEPYPTSPLLYAIVQGIIIILSGALVANLAHNYREHTKELQRISQDLAQRSHDLEESTSQLDQAQAVAKVGSWVYIFRERALELSAEGARILNLPRRIEGDVETFLALAHPDDRDAARAAWIDAVATGNFQNQHRTVVDGKTRWLSQTAKIERTPEGIARRVIGIVRDITERKLAEETLRLSEERFSTAFHSSPLAASISRPEDGYFIDANPNYERYFGWKREELVGSTSAKSALWIKPDDRANWLSALMRDGRVVDWISTWRHKQGHLLDISISAELVDVHGERCILAYIADITERSKAEKALHDSETLLRTVVDEIPEPVVLKDENANFVLCNKSVADLYNTTPDAMIGKHDGDFGVPAEMAEFFRDNVLRIMATGQAETVIEDSRNATTGEIRHYKSIKKPFQVADGKNRILIIAHDITDIVRSQALIAENEKRLQEVMNVTLEGVWDWHVPSGRVVHNAQWYRSLGLTPGEFPGTMAAFSELVHRNDQEAVREKLDAMLGGVQDSYSSVHRLRHSDGWYLWVKDRGRIVERDATGAPLRIIGSFSDITESVRTQDELEAHRNHLEDIVNARTAELAAARDAAEEASRAKSLFLANMSHELRTPMNAIMGMTNLALRLAENPQQNDWLTKSLDASQHLLDVINDILDVSRIEANRVVLEARNFDPAHVIGEALAMQTTAALGKGLRLVPEIDPALPQMVCGDAMRLRQIVINFLGNAIKFSDTGVITARIRPVKWEGNIVQLRIEIADQGIGISAEQQMRLFQAFSQADSSMSRRYGGTGLGLVISKRIANLMGGNVGVISAEGQGSTFWAEVSLKLANVERDVPNQVTAESARELLERTYAGLRVLIAEDEMLNQEVTACLLQEAGLIPEVASNGKEALAMAAATDYAVILMDVQMPVMNGLEATRAIRELPGRATTPILAMTANAFDEDREKCLAAGMNAHLGKPYRPETLFAALLKYLRESGAPRAS